MLLFYLKLIAIVIILLTGLLGGKLALHFSSSKQNNRIFSLGNSFSAGIFLGAGLIHMLPDALENYSKIISSDFPWVFFLCALGFLIILGLEQVVVGGHFEIAVDKSSQPRPVTSYLLTIVLSIHSIITGIALGTENTLSLSIVIFIAVLAHKGSASFALTTNLCKSKVQKSHISSIILLFSLMTPIGIIIGAILDTVLSGDIEHLIEGGFDSIAAGTFLYVAIVDIINEEFAIKKDLSLKIVFTSLGLSVMTILAIWL